MAERAIADSKPIRVFLKRALGKKKNDDGVEIGEALMIEEALFRAADRYMRYSLHKDSWRSHARRRKKHEEISFHAKSAAALLAGLDIISRDDLDARFGRERVATIIDDLHALVREIDRLGREVQRVGRSKNLAEERWIWDVAAIYENAFGKTASVQGSGSGRNKRRGAFYELLEVSRPESFPLYGKLHPKQIAAVLKRRSFPLG